MYGQQEKHPEPRWPDNIVMAKADSCSPTEREAIILEFTDVNINTAEGNADGPDECRGRKAHTGKEKV